MPPNATISSELNALIIDFGDAGKEGLYEEIAFHRPISEKVARVILEGIPAIARSGGKPQALRVVMHASTRGGNIE